jgi:arabinofuranan 3-O-arabinosyltransferase
VATTPASRDEDAQVIEWGATHREVGVPDASHVRILETTENANDGWRATLNGAALTPVRVDGWRQGWILPAGTGGVVALEFTPQAAYVGGLAAGASGVLALLVLALAGRGSRRGEAAPSLGPSRGWTLAAAAPIAGLLLGGLPGLAVAALAVGAGYALPRSWVAGGLAAGAAVGAALAPWPGSREAPDAVLIATSLMAIAALAAASAPGRTRPESPDEPTAAQAARE